LSAILFLLLILSQDIELNPGPAYERNNFSFCHANVRSVLVENKLDDLVLRAVHEDYAIMALSETWLDDSIANERLKIDGYEMERNDRNRQGGGVAFYVRNDIGYKLCHDLGSDLFEVLWIKVFVPGGFVMFGVLYIPPELGANDIREFMDYLERSIDAINQSSALSIIITGDFNAKSNQWYDGQGNNVLGIKLFDFVAQYNMVQLVSEPTRVKDNTLSLIDLIITDSPARVTDHGVSPAIFRSDHYLIWATLDFRAPKRSFVKQFYDLRRTDIPHLKRKLAEFDWNQMYAREDFHENIDNWLTEFYNIIQEHTHITRCRVRSNDKPWFRNHLKHLVNVRHRLFKKAKVRNRAEDWAQYRQAAQQCVEALNNAREEYCNSLVDSLSEFPTASKKWWNVTKELIGKKSGDSIPLLQNSTGEYICDDVGKCNILNRCFASQSSVDDRNAELPEPLLCTDATLDNLLFYVLFLL
jgi:hypothetical protein